MTLLPGVVVMVGLPLVVGADLPLSKLLAAIPGLIGLVVTIRFSVDVSRRDKRELAERARREVLDPIRPESSSGSVSTSLSLLDAARCRSRFYSRVRELERLTGWLESASTIAVVDGPALSGKKRLAIEWAESVPPAWVVGWMRRGRGDDVVDRVVGCGEDAVILADGFSADLGRLLERVSAHGSEPRVRVLVIARDSGGMFERLRRVSSAVASLTDTAAVIHLEAIGGRGDHERWFDELCRYYAGAQVPPVSSGGHRRLPPVEAPPIGLLHVAALGAVRGRTPPTGYLDLEGELHGLWTSEISAWTESRTDPAWALDNLSDAQVDRAVLALAMLASSDLEVAEAVLRRVPELTDQDSGTLRNLTRWARYVYPAPDFTATVDIRPHLIADFAFLRLVAKDPSFAEVVLHPQTHDQALTLIVRLTGTAPLLPAAATAIGVVIGKLPERLRMAVDEALTNAPRNPHLDRQLAESVQACRLDESETSELLGLISPPSLPLAHLALASRAVAHHRERGVADTASHEPDLARALHNQAIRLSSVGGRARDALAAVDEAVAIYRRLAAEVPARFAPDLAGALHNQASHLSEVGGRAGDALAAADEAVAIYRRLPADIRARFEPDLAGALHNQAIRLSELGGRTRDALAAADEAVAIYRRLPADIRPRYEPDLAGALHNQAIRLSEVGGRTGDALDAVDAVVAIYRRLPADIRPRYEPNLAMALHYQSVRIAEAFGPRDGFPPAKEALAIYRHLALDNPQRWGDDRNLALSWVRQLLEAQGHSEEAITEALTEGQPGPI